MTCGYFSVSADGHLLCHPERDPSKSVDLKRLVDSMQLRGLDLPLLVRFNGVLKDRIREIHDVFARALQIHGSLGLSTEMPFAAGVLDSFHMGLADGPTEVHKVTVARQLLGRYKPADEPFPEYHLIRREEAARAKYAKIIGKG